MVFHFFPTLPVCLCWTNRVMCWSDRVIVEGYQCMMANSRRWLTLSSRNCLWEGPRKTNVYVKNRIGFFPLWLILFYFFVVYFLIRDVMRRARTFFFFFWKDYRDVVADLPCFVASQRAQKRAGQLNHPVGCGLLGLLGRPTNVSNLHQHFHSDCPTMRCTRKSLCVAIHWKIKNSTGDSSSGPFVLSNTFTLTPPNRMHTHDTFSLIAPKENTRLNLFRKNKERSFVDRHGFFVSAAGSCGTTNRHYETWQRSSCCQLHTRLRTTQTHVDIRGSTSGGAVRSSGSLVLYTMRWWAQTTPGPQWGCDGHFNNNPWFRVWVRVSPSSPPLGSSVSEYPAVWTLDIKTSHILVLFGL